MTGRGGQELFWAGQFGDDYIERNTEDRLLATNTALFARALSRTDRVQSVIELGANIGLNLSAINHLLPGAEMCAVEINEKAGAVLAARLPHVSLACRSIFEFKPERTWDVAFTKGVLIHIDPDRLAEVYEVLHRCSARYILICEYYNPSPVEIPYRGHNNRLYKRDFAGEMLDRFADLRLLDYGFIYRRDLNFSQDDITWFLLEKRSAVGTPAG